MCGVTFKKKPVKPLVIDGKVTKLSIIIFIYLLVL